MLGHGNHSEIPDDPLGEEDYTISAVEARWVDEVSSGDFITCTDGHVMDCDRFAGGDGLDEALLQRSDMGKYMASVGATTIKKGDCLLDD